MESENNKGFVNEKGEFVRGTDKPNSNDQEEKENLNKKELPVELL